MEKRRERLDGPPNEFALRLRALREERKPSLRALAKLVGVSAVTMWKWEQGYCHPRTRFIPALVKALGVPVGSLMASAGADGALVFAPNPEAHEGMGAAISGQSEALANVVAQAKQMIAKVAGNSPDKIVIHLDL